jgi:type I restriction enzyme M protein
MAIAFEEMKTKVWGAADILRGSIDSSDYKSYIFGFFRIPQDFGEVPQRP